MKPGATAPPRFPVSVIGHAGGSGLASNASMFLAAFQDIGVNHRFIDCHRMQTLQVWPQQSQAEPSGGGSVAASDVALYTVNADEFPAARARFESQHAPRHSTRPIGFFLWETTRAPRLHRLVRPLLSEVWVPTEFVRQVYRELFDDAVPVVRIGKCIRVPSWLEPKPHATAATGQPFVFLNISDFDSSIVRKNPLPVVQAFRRAFPDDPDVRLVLKVRRIDPGHWSNTGNYWEQVLAAMGGDPRIRILAGDLPVRSYWQLLQSSSCYVTLHRAEGFCYGAAHAMLVGVPVIATDFSGTQDFCTSDTSWPVAAELVPVKPGEMRFHEDLGLWASPDVQHAAQQMSRVRAGGPSVATRVASAQQALSQNFGAETFQASLRQRLSGD